MSALLTYIVLYVTEFIRILNLVDFKMRTPFLRYHDVKMAK